MWYAVFSYIRFLWHSTNRHGVHSPFVYRLIDDCFADKTTYPAYPILKNYYKQLLADKRELMITDFGAGSKVFSTATRKVATLARHSGTHGKKQRLLYRLCRYLKARKSLELGTSLGLGTLAMALHENNQVLSLEGCPEVAVVAREKLAAYPQADITVRTGAFAKTLPQLQGSFDVLFMDGNHTEAATLEQFEQLLPHTHNDSVVVVDDIYWSSGMTAAWNQLCRHPKVTVSIDTYYFGLLFFRKEQPPQSFRIRV